MSSPKELKFFVAERNWTKGLEWYESRFAQSGDAVAIGEASPIYSMAHAFAGVPERIASLIPDAKLIYVMRHPIERMKSHYLHRVAHGSERRPVERALRESTGYLNTSRYAYQLEQYLEWFPREQIMLIRSEELRDRRLHTLQRVFGFLNIDTGWVPLNLQSESHKTDEKHAP